MSHYILANNMTNITRSFDNPCKPDMSCIHSFNLSNLSISIHDEHGERKNRTILDYLGTIQFMLIPVNGAGYGDSATCMCTPHMETGMYTLIR